MFVLEIMQPEDIFFLAVIISMTAQ